jgi:hypothetical protein
MLTNFDLATVIGGANSGIGVPVPNPPAPKEAYPGQFADWAKGDELERRQKELRKQCTGWFAEC